MQILSDKDLVDKELLQLNNKDTSNPILKGVKDLSSYFSKEDMHYTVQLLSLIGLSRTPWTAACQPPLSSMSIAPLSQFKEDIQMVN